MVRVPFWDVFGIRLLCCAVFMRRKVYFHKSFRWADIRWGGSQIEEAMNGMGEGGSAFSGAGTGFEEMQTDTDEGRPACVSLVAPVAGDFFISFSSFNRLGPHNVKRVRGSLGIWADPAWPITREVQISYRSARQAGLEEQQPITLLCLGGCVLSNAK